MGDVNLLMKLKNLQDKEFVKSMGAEHANVQPHSGAQANTAVYLAYYNMEIKC